MPFFGPWQEGRIHEEIIHGDVSADYDPAVVYELLSPGPTRRSGWTIAPAGWRAIAAVNWSHWGGISDPPPPRPENSLKAFVAATGLPVTESGWGLQYDILSSGARIKASVGSEWSASHGWTFRGTEYRMGYQHIGDMNSRYSIPVGMDANTAEYTVQLEPWTTGEVADVELIGATVLGPGDLGDYGLYCKDAGAGAAHFLNHGPTSVANSQINMAPFDLNVPTMADIMEETRGNGFLDDPIVDVSNNHPSMPRVSWLYKGPALSDAHFDGSRDVSHAEGMPVAIKITYKMPRWRQYFFDDELAPPYRRNFPRGDGLAGGAGRNWPRARSIQSGNRTSGGYL